LRSRGEGIASAHTCARCLRWHGVSIYVFVCIYVS
jgi:hypothetical protein